MLLIPYTPVDMLPICCTRTSQLVTTTMPAAFCVRPRRFNSDGQDQLNDIFRRLEALESRLNGGRNGLGAACTKDHSQHAAYGSHPGSDASFTERAAGKAAEVLDEAANDAVQKLHPALIKFLNSGYLVSQQQLRKRLMQIEWEGSKRAWAQRKGLAEFEKWLVEKGEAEGVTVEWGDLQALFHNPDDLSPLVDNPRALKLAHALIERAMLDQQLETYKTCTEAAQQLAHVVVSGQRTGASTLLAALRKLVPFFR